MSRIYRVSGLRSAGSASVVARAISATQAGLRVKVDAEQGLVDVEGQVNDYMVAKAIKDSGCAYLGVLGQSQETK